MPHSPPEQSSGPPLRSTSGGGGRSSVGGVLLMALVVRLLWLVLTPETPLQGDDATYVALARSIVAGDGYVAFGEPSTHYLPGWPLVLSLVFAAGIGLHGARLLLCLASTLVTYEAGLLGERLHSPRVGRAAAWIAALFPPLVWYSRVLTSETLAAVLLGAWSLVGPAYLQAGGGGRRILALFALGWPWAVVPAELVVMAPLPFLVRGASGRQVRDWARAVGACLAVAVALAPWWLYNERRFGEFIPLSTGGGVGLWIVSRDPPITDFDAPEFQEAA